MREANGVRGASRAGRAVRNATAAAVLRVAVLCGGLAAFALTLSFTASGRAGAQPSAAAPSPPAAAPGQVSGIKRTMLQRVDIAGAEPKECVFASAEIAPGASVGKHIHHGIELTYVVEGDLELLVDGEPTRRLKAGESFRIDARKPHDGRNVGAGPAKVVTTYVVEKGKPLAEPVK